MSVNMTVQSGVVRSPALRYDSQSRAEFRFTLDQTEGDWHLYLPCFSPGAAGERLASELDDGMSIVITSGKLAYRNRTTKLGEQSRMEILVWAVDRLTESPQDARAEASEGDPPSPVEIVAPEGEGAAALPKKGKRRYPKWTPETAGAN